MQSKLMKYEWKAFQKPLIIIVSIIAIITALCCLMMTLFPIVEITEQANVVSTLTFLGSFAVYYIVVIACGLAVTLLIGIRYYKSMYSDQAYLTHTLPVTKKALFSSKITVSAIFTFLCSALIMISVLFIIPVFIGSMSSPEEKDEIMSSMMNTYGAGTLSPIAFVLLFVILYLIMLLLGSFSSTVMIFCSVTLGQLFTRHRIIGAILCYFGITAIQSIVSGIGYLPFYVRVMISATLGNDPSALAVIGMCVVPSILIFILSLVLLRITYKQLDNNLNLE